MAGFAVSAASDNKGLQGRTIHVLHDGNSLDEVRRLTLEMDPLAGEVSTAQVPPTISP